MKKFLRYASLFNCLALGGCFMGELGAMSANERAAYLASIRPYGSYWVKNGVSTEQKRQDSWACGALPIADAENRPAFSNEIIRAARLPEDPNDIAAEGRVYKAWTECMKGKGYERRAGVAQGTGDTESRRR